MLFPLPSTSSSFQKPCIDMGIIVKLTCYQTEPKIGGELSLRELDHRMLQKSLDGSLPHSCVEGWDQRSKCKVLLSFFKSAAILFSYMYQHLPGLFVSEHWHLIRQKKRPLQRLACLKQWFSKSSSLHLKNDWSTLHPSQWLRLSHL